MAIDKQTTKMWRDKIELAVAEASKAVKALGDILYELDGLGEDIEEQVDSQSTELEKAEKEVLSLQISIAP